MSRILQHQVRSRPIEVVIAGSQKSGTTSLHRYLEQHPEIHTHERSEVTYFLIDSDYRNGYQKAYSIYFQNCPVTGGLLLAKHVMLMYSPKAIKRLSKHNPNAEIILLLRNPVRRAYSAYCYARQLGHETLQTFEEALDAEPKRMEEGWIKWRQCAYVHNSRYFRHIQRIMECFGKENLQIYLLEDLQQDPGAICRKIFEHLKVDTRFSPAVSKRHNRGAAARSKTIARLVARMRAERSEIIRYIRPFLPNSLVFATRRLVQKLNEKPFTPPPMNPETKRRLINCFSVDNQRLANLINRDLTLWNR